VRSLFASGLVIVTLLVVLAAPGASAQGPSGSPAATDVCAPFGGTDVPPTGSTRTVASAVTAPAEADPYACPLPAWDDVTVAWPFPGTVDTEHAYRWPDASGESADPQTDLVATAWAPVRLSRRDANRIRRDGSFSTLGDPARAIRDGRYLIVQLETAETPEIATGANRAFHVATDRAGDAENNSPSGVAAPSSPFQDTQDVYTSFLVGGRDTPSLYATDLAGKVDANGSPWYNARGPFAARITQETPGVQFLLPMNRVGDTFRSVTATTRSQAAVSTALIGTDQGTGGPPRVFDQGTVIPEGSDFGAVGTKLGLFPRNGIANAMVGCLEADTIHLPVDLDSLAVNGRPFPESQMPSQTPVIWCTWPTFEDGDALASWFNSADADGDGVTIVPVTVRVKEAWWDTASQRTVSLELTQVGEARVTLRGGNLYVGVVIGLGMHGYHDILSIELGSTLNEGVDAILQRSADTAVAVMPAWSVDETEGWTAGDPECIPGEAREAVIPAPR
jgi:hypothetical protein